MKQVVVFVSSRDAQRVGAAIVRTGGDRIGNYIESVTHTASLQYGELKAMDEKKFEFACDDETYAAILKAIDLERPYHPTTVEWWPLETMSTVR